MIVNRLMRNKQVIILAGCACLGGYLAYRYWKKRLLRTIDEGFEDVMKIDEINDRRVLLIGMHGSGKTTLMKEITAANKDENNVTAFPTYDFVMYKLQKNKYNFEILKIGGHSDDKNSYSWANESIGLLNDIDLIVFMVDSSDLKKLPGASHLLKELLGDIRLHSVPVLIVANKQDLPTALSPDEVKEALDLKSIVPYNDKIHVVGCQMGSVAKDQSQIVNSYSSSIDIFNKIFTLAVHS